MVSKWEPAHSLVEDAISGAKIAPCLLALAVTWLPLYLQWSRGWGVAGKELVCSLLALLWHSLNPLFCERARMWLRLELFFLSLSLFIPLSVPQFVLLSYVSSLRLSSGHSGLVLNPM